MTQGETNPYRLIPSVEDTLGELERRSGSPEAAGDAEVSRELLLELVQETLDGWRAEIKAGELDAAGLEARLKAGEPATAVLRRIEREKQSGLVRVVNAAGVVLHTGLGRAPIHPEAAAAMARAAQGYCVLEVDRFSGRRNQRDDRLSVLLQRLTGAEAGIVVNNNASAVLLTLSTFAAGQGTVVSRGELVEIGGSFRVPDVMERAGTRLVEVGTTNRTRASDYSAAAGDDIGLFYKVHSSNFRQVGFTEELDAPGLAQVGRECGIATAFDLGSGLLEGHGTVPLPAMGDEPLVREAVESGVDVVSFSGDKLLGGPQAGMLVGKSDAIARLRRNPLYRALRLDKVTIAGLETTLDLYLAGRGDEIPARAMLLADPVVLRETAEVLAREIGALGGFETEVTDDHSQPGSGSAPGVFLPTSVVRVTSKQLSTEQLAARLRAGDPCVFARIEKDQLLLDPRTLVGSDREDLVAAFAQIAADAGA